MDIVSLGTGDRRKIECSSLLDKDGYFHLTESEARLKRDPKASRDSRSRAQIERARALGIQPTHLDSHMGTLYQNKALFEVFLRVARNQKLPVRVAKTWFARADFLPSTLNPDDVYIDRVLDINPTVAPARLGQVLHRRDQETRTRRDGESSFTLPTTTRKCGVQHSIILTGAPRGGNAISISSPAMRSVSCLQENQIKLITWRELGKLIK